jgi:tetratricopeptide (TPR) repeat protein
MIAIHQAIWSNYFQVGEAALASGDSFTAEAMFRESLIIASVQALEPMHEANSAFALALALLPQRPQRAEAQQLMRRAVRIYATVENLDCQTFVSCVSSLADSYCQEDFPERALPLLKQAVKIVSQKTGLAAPYLVPLFKRMALIYSEKKYYSKADECFRRSLQLSM